ncbi:hypothetical protein [Streptomyces sp. NPDC046862]|uniref:hypothetical protein n=1 Tax=Streptomyces sp. NPDC046862 TaxID=3154603 RepID=UPI003452AFB7
MSRVALHSRQGTSPAASLPQTEPGNSQPLDATTLDGELMVWERDRLAFEQPQQRLPRRRAPGAQAARERPAQGCGAGVAGVAAAGVEGLRFKPLDESYRKGVPSWRKYKVRVTTEAMIGAVTGSIAAPRTLLGRHDPSGRLQYVGRSTTLSRAAGRAVADQLARPHGAHPWTGWTFRQGGERSAPSMPSWCSPMP